MNDDKEQWRFIPSYGTQYSVSNEGRIRSNRTGTILAVIKGNRRGECPVVRLFNDKKRREHSIARIVWTAFNGPVPKGHVVRQTMESTHSLKTLELCLRGHLYRKGNKRAAPGQIPSKRKAKTRKNRKDSRTGGCSVHGC